MKKRTKRLILVSLSAIAVSAVLLAPGLPWSPGCRHFLKKLLTRADMTVAAWEGTPAELISLKGRFLRKKEPLREAEIEVLDSISGWAGLTGENGDFSLRDVQWYPGAGYTLIVSANDYQSRTVNVRAPASPPPGSVLDLGELDFDSGCRVDLATLRGRNSITTIAFDERNALYYRTLFDQLTEDRIGDEERLGAISRYVSERLAPGSADHATPSGRRIDSASPREVLDQGSRYCGQLAVALATIAEAGNYRCRVLDLIDPAPLQSTHMVVEVFYGDRWHLYDPFIEGSAGMWNGRVASYADVRLDADLTLGKPVREHLPGSYEGANWMADLYRSGLHHYYYIKR